MMAFQVISNHRMTCDNVQKLKFTRELNDLVGEVILDKAGLPSKEEPYGTESRLGFDNQLNFNGFRRDC